MKTQRMNNKPTDGLVERFAPIRGTASIKSRSEASNWSLKCLRFICLREKEHKWKGQRKREKDSQEGCARNMESGTGLDLTTLRS